jgi:hypothetical protein
LVRAFSLASVRLRACCGEAARNAVPMPHTHNKILPQPLAQQLLRT